MRVFFAFCKDAPNDRFLEANVHMEKLSLTVARHCGVFRHSVVKTLLVKGKTATRRKNCAALNKQEIYLLEKFIPVWAAECDFFEKGGIISHPDI